MTAAIAASRVDVSDRYPRHSNKEAPCPSGRALTDCIICQCGETCSAGVANAGDAGCFLPIKDESRLSIGCLQPVSSNSYATP